MRDLIERIQGAAARQDRPFAVFDFDNTCIKGDIAEAAIARLCETGRFDPSLMREYERLLSAGEMRQAFLSYGKAFAGMALTDIETIVADTIRSAGIIARESVLELARSLEQVGIAVWVVSASPEALVAAAMRQLGFPGRVIGLRNEIADGKLTDRISQPYSMLEGKVDCIKALIRADERPAFAIGDSLNDLPMLECAEVAAAIDRGGSFTDMARERGWTILPG